MDSWPAWARSIAVVVFIGATVLWITFAPNAYFWLPRDQPLGYLMFILWQAWTGVFIWYCIAAAPRFKVAVGVVLAVALFHPAAHLFFAFPSERWIAPWHVYDLTTYLLIPDAWPFAIGVLAALALSAAGAFQRSPYYPSTGWLLVIVVLFVVLSVGNALLAHNGFDTLISQPIAVPPRLFSVLYWFIGRELALAAVALLCAWGYVLTTKRITVRAIP